MVTAHLVIAEVVYSLVIVYSEEVLRVGLEVDS